MFELLVMNHDIEQFESLGNFESLENVETRLTELSGITYFVWVEREPGVLTPKSMLIANEFKLLKIDEPV